MPDFKKLLVWQKAQELATEIDLYAAQIARRKPRLADQLERAAWAIPAAIAEGSGLGTDKAFANSCSTAIGEASEVENHLQRARDTGLLEPNHHERLTGKVVEVRRMLFGLRNTLRGTPKKNQQEKKQQPPAPDS